MDEQHWTGEMAVFVYNYVKIINYGSRVMKNKLLILDQVLWIVILSIKIIGLLHWKTRIHFNQRLNKSKTYDLRVRSNQAVTIIKKIACEVVQ